MNRTVATAALAALLAGSAMAGAAAKNDAPPAEATAPAVPVMLDYGGATWAVDPAKGPVQAVVTKRTTVAGGTTIEGIVFIKDGGGWRVAGVFQDDSPDGVLLVTGVDGELTLAPAGG